VVVQDLARGTALIKIPDSEALGTPDEVFDSYTVMVPVFREPEVMSSLVEHLRHLDYPAERLQILLLAEADDSATIAAARVAIGAAADLRILIVPRAATHEAQGAQLRPDPCHWDLPHHLRRRRPPGPLTTAQSGYRPLTAAARGGLSAGPPRLLQRRPKRHHALVPGRVQHVVPPNAARLVEIACPHTLGGTSNHFRKEVLLDLGAWDPYNVTEDADLGVRLSRAGYRSEVMDSLTLEEANSDFVNWAKQRSRWYKGYLQTFLVHMRDFRESQRLLGTRRLLFLMLFVGGTPLMAMVNPIFWTLTVVWFVVKPAWLMAVFPAPLYFLGLFCWLAGNFLFTFTCMLEAIEVDDSLFVAALLTPVYWVMMSVAAYKALVQVFFAPAYWEKTRHGLAKAVVGATAPARPTP